MRARALGLACAAALAVAGCGGSGSTTRTTVHTTTTSASTPAPATTTTHAAPRRHHPPRPAGPPVGATQRVHAGATTLAVTVTHVLDPLHGAGASGPPGTRPVGVQLTIVNEAGATYDSTASGDVSVVLSTGQAAPLFVKAGVCQTPLTDFESLIGVGETRSGCVGFSVPRHARIAGVRFSPHSRAAGTVSWR